MSSESADSELARLAAIVESSDDAIISKNLRGIITTWNKGAERLLGYARDEIVGKPITLLIPPDRHPEEAGIGERLRRGERVDHFETAWVARDGTLRDVSVTVSPLRDTSDRIVGTARIVRDISERKRMEAEVSRARARMRAILDTAVDAIISIDGGGAIQSVNPAGERMFGYGAHELIGQNIKVLMPAPYREKHDEYLARGRRADEPRIVGTGREVQARRKDGTVFAIDLAVSEVETGTLFTGIVRDISDRKTAEAKLREADRMASIGTLAAGLGHDMNNVLLPVKARLNALKAEGKLGRLSAMASRDVSEIAKSIAYLQQLADGLHFLVMDPDKDDGAGNRTDLAAWWSQAGALISKAVPKHVRVAAVLPADLPRVAVAAHALTQAVLNLVVNAGDAIPAGRKRREGHVRIRGEPANDRAHVKLSVTDNGVGMSDEVKRRAFDVFFTTKPRGLGTGLGLPLVRKVVDRAGGFMGIESMVGQGTTVWMLLPVVRATAAPVESPRAVISLADGRASVMVRHVLEGLGVRVDQGEDPTDARIWVADPGTIGVAAAGKWRKRQHRGRLVLFGNPDQESGTVWAALKPVIITDPADLGAIRAGLARAVDGL